nr:MAG TPA: hypothetical protein [Caudoviricetes sp.]
MNLNKKNIIMKRTTVIFQAINNDNAHIIIFHLHKLFCRKPNVCRRLLNKMEYQQVYNIERRVSQQFWWLYKGEDFQLHIRSIVFKKYKNGAI